LKRNFLASVSDEILSILLKDYTTGKNILWGTDNYTGLGAGFCADDSIDKKDVGGYNSNFIHPVIAKEGEARTEDIISFVKNIISLVPDNEEEEPIKEIIDGNLVYTSDTIVDENEENAEKPEKINFFYQSSSIEKAEKFLPYETAYFAVKPDNPINYNLISKQFFVKNCGEGQYFVTRYDNTTGKTISISERGGIVDKKLSSLGNDLAEDEWQNWAKDAYRSVYGYEFCGTKLLIARANLLLTYEEYYEDVFGLPITEKDLKEVANIIIRNIIQADGKKGVIPYSCGENKAVQLSFFDMDNQGICEGCLSGNNLLHRGIFASYYDWDKDKNIRLVDEF